MTALTISESVTEICIRAGLDPSQFDVTGLASITMPVRALAITQVSSARVILDMLGQCYAFDAVLSDKLYFVARGGPSVATIDYSELGVRPNGNKTSMSVLPLTQANELEVPAQVALTYSNVDADHNVDTEYSDRLITGQESVSSVQVPLGFKPNEAKQIVERMLSDQAWRLKTTLALGMKYTKLQPTNIITVNDKDGSQYRLRLVKRNEVDGTFLFDAEIDDQTVLVQMGATSTGMNAQGDVFAAPNTELALLDLPMLFDTENVPGLYIAMAGENIRWAFGVLFESVDNVTYNENSVVTDQAAIGVCTTILGPWYGGRVFDEFNVVRVNVGTNQQLYSYTREEVLTEQAPVYSFGNGELCHALNATLVSAGVYDLTGLLRGVRGTEWAMNNHVADEQFVELNRTGDGIRFIELSQAALGSLRYYKAVSNGQDVPDVSATAVLPMGNTLKPYAPTNARMNREIADHTLTFDRRTRLASRLVGAMPIYVPLGEDTEEYDIEFFIGSSEAIAGVPVLRTIHVTDSPSCVYTSAQRSADGTGSSVAYVRIYQLSSSVGRGYPLIATV